MKEFKITEKERNTMLCELRPWRMEDATELQKILNNKKILDNLRDGIPYPYTLADAKAFIQSMSEAEPEFHLCLCHYSGRQAGGQYRRFSERKYSFPHSGDRVLYC